MNRHASPLLVLAALLAALLAGPHAAMAGDGFVLPEPQPMPDEPAKPDRPVLLPAQEPVYVNPWNLGAPQRFFGFRTGYKLDVSKAHAGKEGLLTIDGAEAPEPWAEFDTYTVEGTPPEGTILRITGHGSLASSADCAAVLAELEARIKKNHGPAMEKTEGERLYWTWKSDDIEVTCMGAGGTLKKLKLVYTDLFSLDLYRYIQSQQSGGQ